MRALRTSSSEAAGKGSSWVVPGVAADPSGCAPVMTAASRTAAETTLSALALRMMAAACNSGWCKAACSSNGSRKVNKTIVDRWSLRR